MPAIAHTNQHSPAVMQAKQMLAKANAAVDADRAAHSPSCVAVDEKRVTAAEIQLSQVAASSSGASPAGSSVLSITV